jgi:Uma2 family endonuclease
MGYMIRMSDRLHPAMAAWRKLPVGIRAEVINEELHILPAPTTYHARLITVISAELSNYIHARELGDLFIGDVDVFLNRRSNAVIPDIMFIANDNQRVTIERRGIIGPPDLIFEILSPGNRKHDLVRKKELYERAGVREYWIVDPETKDAQGYLLKGRKYDEPLLMNSEVSLRILKKKIKF